MSLTVSQIAAKVGGCVEGDGTIPITGMAGVEEAGPGDITFLADPRYAAAAARTKAAAILVSESWKGAAPCVCVRVANPDRAFTVVAGLLAPPTVRHERGVHPTAIVADGVQLGQDVCVGPYCVLEPGAKVGDRTVLDAGCYLGQGTAVGRDCRLYPHVTVREYAKIGDRVIIHNGAVIGSDGFGYYREGAEWKKIPQVGVVEIGNDVEIGANVTVDRARFGKTVIGKGVKIDNLVQIAHNVQIGDNTAMAAQVGISGSAKIGKNCQIGGQAGFAGHLEVGDNSVVGAQSGVAKDLPSGSYHFGTPSLPMDRWKKIFAMNLRLPEVRQKMADMEKRLAELEKKSKGAGTP
jgi:UDP-3-O-[3-hydroxymyristoyl] glucosamine N-acyltransferase